MTASQRFWSAMVLFGLAACSADRIPTGVRPILPTIASARAPAESLPKHWRDASDEVIWREVAYRDTQVRVGLKAAGTQRGVIRGRLHLTRDQWIAGIQAIATQPGVRVISADSLQLPMLVIVPADLATLKLIRRLPFVDFLEPKRQRVMWMSNGCSYSGSTGSSGESGSSGDASYGGSRLYVPSVTGGTDVVAAVYGQPGMNVLNAWQLSSGDDVRIGVTDTGLDYERSSSEFNDMHFAEGMSDGRGVFVWQNVVNPGCSHGTRVAGIAAAPRNGRSIAGVAFRSDLFTFHQADGEVPDEYDAQIAIQNAANGGSKVIIMAWGLLNGSTGVDNTIDYYYYQDDIVFVGAAGTCPIGGSCPQMNSAVFPASKGEVLAVAGAEHDGQKPNNMYDWGSKPEGVVAYTNLATTGNQTDDIVNLGGSSGATAFVGGAAALVRARYPSLTAGQIVERIVRTSVSCAAAGAWRPLINVSAAVGGPCVTAMEGANEFFHNFNTELDFFVLVRRPAPDGFDFGGSGSYNAVWEIGAGAEVTYAATDEYTDPLGTYWRSLRRLRFLHAWDGGTYRVDINVSVHDNVLGTVDNRQRSVAVCETFVMSGCVANRSFPGSNGPLSITSISGPTYIVRFQSAQYTTGGTGGAPSYTYQWRVREGWNSNFGAWGPWSSPSTQNYTYTSVNSCGVNTKQIEAKVTDSASASATTSKTIYVNNPC
jgi:hypothetical protein